MNTPWGKSDSTIRIKRGLSWVSTPSHGGFMVSEKYAQKHLSPAALLRGDRCGGYYAYEEDCDFAIIAWELFGFIQNPILSLVDASHYGLGEFKRETLLSTLSSYHADYLIAVGTEPDPQGLANFNAHKLRDRMRADKSPDLVVSAVGDWHKDCPKGFVLVTCADDSRWLVHASEYDNPECRHANFMKSATAEMKWNPRIVTLLSTFTNPIPQGHNGGVN